MPFTSIIFQTTNPNQVTKLIPFFRLENNPDLIQVNQDASGITIETIRNLQSDFSQKPYVESHKIVILYDAQSMNIVCQNALLKSLEEPPAHLQLILVTSSPSVLLSTIRSRCQLITDTLTVQTVSQFPSLSQLQVSSVPEVIDVAAQIKERSDASIYVLQLIDESKHQLASSPTLKLVSNLKALQQAYLMLQANTNVKMVMEWIGFQISSH